MQQPEYDTIFPSKVTGLPPSPTIENPGRVFPRDDPAKASVVSPRQTTPIQYVGNPFLMNNALDKLDHAFGEVITILEQENRSQDREEIGNGLLHKFKSWRDELERLRLGEEALKSETIIDEPGPAEREGGMFTD
ncbi:hypothetical protein BDZ97DRAFT_1914594 [Flammula alnicola]|nr:hypothetical protein BDZ97DRAFT_329367 [Flammula alnicola]KAF8970720.1 hypothetical protein BDZ97DRAFT_1914594 [Flammula alnicola]